MLEAAYDDPRTNANGPCEVIYDIVRQLLPTMTEQLGKITWWDQRGLTYA